MGKIFTSEKLWNGLPIFQKLQKDWVHIAFEMTCRCFHMFKKLIFQTGTRFIPNVNSVPLHKTFFIHYSVDLHCPDITEIMLKNVIETSKWMLKGQIMWKLM